MRYPGKVAELFPLFLRLTGRTVLVVGAGSVGTRKIEELIAAGAQVRVVAPHASFAALAHATAGKIELRGRAFEPADLDGAWLCIAATNDSVANAAIAVAAEARRIFVNAVDDPVNASAFFASIIRRPPFLIAISSSGQLPALSRLLREVLERALPEARYIAAARALRKRWRAESVEMGSRFGELLRTLRDLPES